MRKKNKNYFTGETEDAIIEYNKTPDTIIKSRIYNDKIHKPFIKLTENIIHTFKFYHTEVSDLKDLQYEVIYFLLSKMHLYNHSKNIQDRCKRIIIKEFKEEYNLNFEEFVGNVDRVTQKQIDDFIEKLDISTECKDKLSKMTPPKAFSYFGTITKRYLIVKNKNIYKKKIDHSSINVTEMEEDIEEYATNNNNNLHPNFIDYSGINDFKASTPTDDLSDFLDQYIDYCNNNLTKLFPKPKDSKIADAILEIFRRREDIEIFNKKAIYIYIKEIVDAKTPKITKITDMLYSILYKKYLHFTEHGYFNSSNN